MPAPIVYDGVSGGGGRGDLLFSGIKFWLAVRVPSRRKFKEKIQSNGGEVVPMERQADILIADDAAPKKAPSNWDSFSWKFIDAAIERGELPDKADYLIPRPTSATTRASIPTNDSSKATRTAFTAEDDRILTEGARRQLATLQGAGSKGSLKGNVFWVDFAAQSVPCSKSPQTISSPQVSDSKASTAKEGGRQRFTAAEDKALIEAVDEARRLGKRIGGKIFYDEFAKANPTHTAESWRSRYLRILAPRLFPDGLPASDDNPEETKHVVTKTRRMTEGDKHDLPDSPCDQLSRAHEEGPTKSAEDLAGSATPEAEYAQLRQVRTPSAQAPKSIGDDDSMESYHSESQTPTTPTHNRQTTVTSDEADAYHMFYDYLGIFLRRFPNTIDTKPRIRGVKIDLFRLQQAVESQEGGFDECDWSRVCKDIGFESPDPELARTVEACYGANLQDFIEALRGFEEDCSEVSSPESNSSGGLFVNQNEPLESDTVLHQASSPGHEGHGGSNDEELAEVQFGSASSPIPRHLGKRQRTTELVNGRRKRTRLSRDVEIPDTPQITSKLQHQTVFDNPENEATVEEQEGDEDDENEGVKGTQKSSNISPSQQLRLELVRSGSKRNSNQTPSQDYQRVGANGRIKVPVVERRDSLRYASRDRLPNRDYVSSAPAFTGHINKDFDSIKPASPRTVSGVSTCRTQALNLPPRSAQPPSIPARSTTLSKDPQPIKEVPVTSHAFSTPKASQRPTASKPVRMSSPLGTIPNDILSDIISTPGPRRHTASFVTPSASSRRAPDASRRPSARQNPPASSREHFQDILPSIEGGHSSNVSTSGCSEQVKRLAGLGYRQEFIDKLLRATSRDVAVMKRVCELKAQKKSQCYRAAGPSESMPNIRGVWTAEEDRKLVAIYEFDQMDEADKTAAARRAIDQDERALKQKHGWEDALEARMRFLTRRS
ncbi:hypothetical protein PpBr36_08329 [Pyricularia pennisetigena]|uniref:hypothetical protein n=1 Tax=Pyricularia pennisetigena TaxID=1578925 RepID=UPI00114FA60A|nr:hypothetical protein PpBr36_08329 [Pyricularia pennisetigena]TLS24061.1 hypothetical protein PpBr36_08329 [Pyricularia pennisetigena]